MDIFEPNYGNFFVFPQKKGGGLICSRYATLAHKGKKSSFSFI